MDYSRQETIFIPDEFKTPIHVIGAGATGSWLVLALAKLGIKDITVWDFDEVEEHNIPNQAYRLQYQDVIPESQDWEYSTDISKPKVVALADMVKSFTGIDIKPRNQRVTGKEKLEGIVFVMTDTMHSRKDIWDMALKYKIPVKLVVEPRMGVDGGRIYCVDPMNVNHVKQYEQTLYTDAEAEVSACGISQSVVATAMQIASMCAWKVINFHNKDTLGNQYLVDARYSSGIYITKWED